MESFDPEGYIAIGRDLLQTIGSERRQIEVMTDRMVNQGHVPLVYALSTHTLRLGRVGLDLYEEGFALEAMPTVRSAYESALTACWLAESREAPAAIFNEDMRQRRVLGETLAKATSAVFRGEADSFTKAEVERLETTADAQARRFNELCNALRPGGTDAYVVYRVMSAFTHPSASLADEYVTEDASSPLGLRLRGNPNAEPDFTWLPILVSSMVWAARAVDVMDRDHTHRSYLRSVAQQLGIAEMLELSPEARRTEQRAETERRRATWKGPRRRGDR